MVKHTHTIGRQFAELSVFDHFVKLALKGLILITLSNARLTRFIELLAFTA